MAEKLVGGEIGDSLRTCGIQYSTTAVAVDIVVYDARTEGT